MSEHVLKVEPPYMDALLDGSKPFEVRQNDRGYQRGDALRLREYDRTRGNHENCGDRYCRLDPFTGREVTLTVTYVYSGDPRWPALAAGFVVLGLAPASPREEPGDERKQQ